MELNTYKIRRELKRLKKTQGWLANKMKISKQLLSYRLNSRRITHAEGIAKALDLDPKDLIR